MAPAPSRNNNNNGKRSSAPSAKNAALGSSSAPRPPAVKARLIHNTKRDQDDDEGGDGEKRNGALSSNKASTAGFVDDNGAGPSSQYQSDIATQNSSSISNSDAAPPIARRKPAPLKRRDPNAKIIISDETAKYMVSQLEGYQGTVNTDAPPALQIPRDRTTTAPPSPHDKPGPSSVREGMQQPEASNTATFPNPARVAMVSSYPELTSPSPARPSTTVSPSIVQNFQGRSEDAMDSVTDSVQASFSGTQISFFAFGVASSLNGGAQDATSQSGAPSLLSRIGARVPPFLDSAVDTTSAFSSGFANTTPAPTNATPVFPTTAPALVNSASGFMNSTPVVYPTPVLAHTDPGPVSWNSTPAVNLTPVSVTSPTNPFSRYVGTSGFFAHLQSSAPPTAASTQASTFALPGPAFSTLGAGNSYDHTTAINSNAPLWDAPPAGYFSNQNQGNWVNNHPTFYSNHNFQVQSAIDVEITMGDEYVVDNDWVMDDDTNRVMEVYDPPGGIYGITGVQGYEITGDYPQETPVVEVPVPVRQRSEAPLVEPSSLSLEFQTGWTQIAKLLPGLEASPAVSVIYDGLSTATPIYL